MRTFFAAAIATMAFCLASCGEPAVQVTDPQSKVIFTLDGSSITVDASETDFGRGEKTILVQCLPTTSYQDLQEKIRGQLPSVQAAWPAARKATVKAPGKKGQRDACVVTVGADVAFGVFNQSVLDSYQRELDKHDALVAQNEAQAKLQKFFDYAQAEAVKHGAYVTSTFTVSDLALALEKVSGTPVVALGDISQLGADEIALSTQTTAKQVVLWTRLEDGRIFQAAGADDAEIGLYQATTQSTTPQVVPAPQEDAEQSTTPAQTTTPEARQPESTTPVSGGIVP